MKKEMILNIRYPIGTDYNSILEDKDIKKEYLIGKPVSDKFSKFIKNVIYFRNTELDKYKEKELDITNFYVMKINDYYKAGICCGPICCKEVIINKYSKCYNLFSSF